jgi:hypothetical protein
VSERKLRDSQKQKKHGSTEKQSRAEPVRATKTQGGERGKGQFINTKREKR